MSSHKSRSRGEGNSEAANRDAIEARLVTTDRGTKIPELIMKPTHFIDQTTILNGPSKTGKTVIIKNIMNMLNGPIEQILVCSPSEVSNHSYDGYVDPALIHSRIFLPDPANPKKDDGVKGTIRFLEALWKRQEMMASIYFRANRLEPLADLFARLPSADRLRGSRAIRELNDGRVHAITQQRRLYKDDPGTLADKVKDLNEKFKTMTALIYKKFISAHLDMLMDRQDALGEDERYSLFYLNFNPRILLLFDDCAAELKPLFPKEIFRKIFYQGRHVFMTTVISCQDDTDLPANLRKNAFMTYFTHESVASSNFERQANRFSHEVRAHAADIIPTVFKKRHRKLVYIREDDTRQHFYWVECSIPEPKMFGSDALQELCRDIKSDGTSMDKDNPYYNKFSL
jgi:hypothetical protein